ncbi:MAG: PAS domain S-box protein [Fibrobacter sp.]|nr:PAS domain S-box protein [Fibrobacter sp.]
MTLDSISTEVLGKINLLQSMVIHVHDTKAIIDAVCRVLGELPGVEDVKYSADKSNPGTSPVEQADSKQLSICYKNSTFGYFTLSLRDAQAFSGYLPFLQNVMNMLGVIFEERQQELINAELTEQLELRVQQRTKELYEQTENLRITFDSIGDAILVTDVAGKVSAINPVAEKLTGWKKSEAVGKPVAEIFRIINSFSRQPVLSPVDEVLVKGKKVKLANHTIMISRDGTEYQIADSAAPIRAIDGSTAGVVLVFRDVTEEYRIQRELQESEAKYRRLIEGIGPRYCVISQSPQGVFTYVSKNFEKLFGISAQSAIGKTWSALNVEPQSITVGKDADKLLRKEHVFQHVEMKILHPGNQYKIIEIYYGPILENGDVVRVEGICTDVTDQRRSEEMLLRSQKLDSIGTLAGGIAHDFNNLLAGIFGYISIAHDTSQETPVKESLAKTLSTINRAKALTNQLLTFAKGGEPRKTIGSLLPLLPDTVRFALSGSSISYEFRFDPDLWFCEFDQNHISQVIDNIVINAKQAMPTGGTINVTAENTTIEGNFGGTVPGGKWVKISITDHGCGISKANLSRIFDPFFTTKHNGHGLGLATSHSIITRHGGCLEVESVLDQGTTITIYLPATEMAPVTREEINTSETVGSGTILLMDDEDFIRAITSAMLNAGGYQTVCCSNGEEVLDMIENRPDEFRQLKGMIFDLTIPGKKGGKEIIDSVRKCAPQTPVFVVSGYADDPVIANPSRYGFTASLCKPFRKQELFDMLSRYFI